MPQVPTKIGNDEVRKGRILIVDDDPDITNSYSLCLEDTGLFEVDTYNEPVEALSNFKANSYDLVLLDIRIRMPKMDGYQLYDKMKKIDTKVKVCPMSAFDMDADTFREKFPTLDTECFIPKPIQINELVKRIETELLR
jgi:DNA-binding response OmpR family regulator